MIRFNGCRSNDDSRDNMAGLNPTNNSTETQHERLLKIEINRCDGERVDSVWVQMTWLAQNVVPKGQGDSTR